MKYLIIILSVLFLSCTSKVENKAIAETEATGVKPTPVMEQIFPFSEADKIEVISYPVRHKWDTIRNDGHHQELNYLVKDQKLMVDEAYIKEKRVLTEDAKKLLFEFLFEDRGNNQSDVACFNPRHSILFYREDKIIAFMEVCLECGNADSDFKYKYENLNYETIGELESIFNEAGIKYYGEGE